MLKGRWFILGLSLLGVVHVVEDITSSFVPSTTERWNVLLIARLICSALHNNLPGGENFSSES